MFTQSFENSERQRQRRQQRELALRRMEEAAGGAIATTSSSPSSPSPSPPSYESSAKRLTSADYASNFLRGHHNDNNMSGSGGTIGDCGSSSSCGGSSNRFNKRDVDGGKDVIINSDGMNNNLHSIKRSFQDDEANEYGEVHGRSSNYSDTNYHDDERDADDNDYEDDDGEYDDDSSMLKPTHQQYHHRRNHYLDREGNMTNHSSIPTKRTWRRPMSRMAICGVVATVTIIIIISVVVSVVSFGGSTKGAVRGSSLISNNEYAQQQPSEDGNDEVAATAAAASDEPLSPQEQERFDTMRTTILQQHISTSQSLSDTSSPQYAAVVWLSRGHDELQETESVYLMQRYGLAVLWFSTTRSEHQWHMTKQESSGVGEEQDNNRLVYDNQGQRDRKSIQYHDPKEWFRHNNWLSSSEICTWEGIACHTHKEGNDTQNDTTNNGLVASIELRRNNVQGLLPEEIYLTLPSLKVLDLSDNGIVGTISSKISNWANLEYLNYTSNNLAGSLPSQIGNLPSLREMHLATNQFGNSIPHTIGNISRLKHLDLSGNMLRGTIPYTIGNLEELSALDLSWNALDGPLPHEISRLQTLVKLDVAHNDLVGPLLLELSGVRYLSVLRLNDNHLSGEVPTEIGSLVHLEELRLNNNDFRGFLPSEISNLVGLGKYQSLKIVA